MSGAENRSLTMGARLSATTTFLVRPQKIRYERPRGTGFGDDRARAVICGREVVGRMIGPATRWGKNETNAANSRKFRVGLMLAAVDVDGVAHRLERVERDADRERMFTEGPEIGESRWTT